MIQLSKKWVKIIWCSSDEKTKGNFWLNVTPSLCMYSSRSSVLMPTPYNPSLYPAVTLTSRLQFSPSKHGPITAVLLAQNEQQVKTVSGNTFWMRAWVLLQPETLRTMWQPSQLSAGTWGCSTPINSNIYSNKHWTTHTVALSLSLWRTLKEQQSCHQRWGSFERLGLGVHHTPLTDWQYTHSKKCRRFPEKTTCVKESGSFDWPLVSLTAGYVVMGNECKDA